MSKLDDVLERLRALPPDRQEAIAEEIDFLIDHPEHLEPILTPEQEAELERRLADPKKTYISHEEVFRRLEKKDGA